jgi:uncharacterized protein YndB with AHSA1/START domain
MWCTTRIERALSLFAACRILLNFDLLAGRKLIELRFERFMRADAARVFALLADLRDYDRWLPPSMAFHGTSRVSEGPIHLGTTYIEESPVGVRHGTVTGFVPPMTLNFEQPMQLKPAFFGEIGIKLFHTLTPEGESVPVLRPLQLVPRGPVTLLMPIIARAFRTENERMMDTLKSFAEAETRH